MKKIVSLLSLILLSGSTAFSQAELSPVEYSNPFPTNIYFGELANFSVIVENTGDSTYVGPLSLTLQTSDGQTEYEQTIYSIYTIDNPISLLPGSYIEINGTDSVTSERYAPYDNTIVVWPTGNAPTRDSLVTQTYVLDPNGIEVLAGINAEIHPNPAQDKISIDAENAEYVRFYDISGRLVIHRKESFESIDISSLDSGVYFVEIKRFDQEAVLEKLMVN